MLGDVLVLDASAGAWFWVHAVYSYLLLGIGATLLARELARSFSVGRLRAQTASILLATIIPWGVNAGYLSGVIPVDLTSLGFALTGLMVAVALFRYRLFDIVPVARTTVVDTIDAAVVVADTDGRIIDANEQAPAFFDRTESELLGSRVGAVFDAYPDLRAQYGPDTEIQTTLPRESDGRLINVEISPIYDSFDQRSGAVVMLRDVTERQRRQRELRRRTTELERQNERLETMASVVSHDLRNPLNVAQGRLDIARETGDDDQFDTIERNLDRMEAIIEDMLTLAQQGQTLTDVSEVSLPTLAEDAWRSVDTGDGDLVVETDRRVTGDRHRLAHVFENLFRNSVDHGGQGVTVTVGDCADGFYVADDGPGIPPEDRESVLERGYTTAETGTGFGLAIVADAVEAHGWDLTITESDTGGARFEITGVEGTAAVALDETADAAEPT